MKPEDAYNLTREFMGLLPRHQARIYSYIVSMVGNFDDADDVMQETCQTMWKKFPGFESGSNFLAWGFAIARLTIYEYRRKKQKNGLVYLEDHVLDEIDLQSIQHQDQTRAYLAHLHDCIDKLNDRDRGLIHMRYRDELKISEIAIRLERTVQAIYHHIGQVHEQLMRCVQRTISHQDYRE